MQNSDKMIFFKFLNQEMSIKDFESFLYDHSKLEKELGEEIYLELISWNFHDNNARKSLEDFLYNNIISESGFETWRLKKLLIQFIESPENINQKLHQFYDLYCRTFDREGEPQKGYKFLGNLGLNYFYWMDEGYLKTNYGEKWKSEYEKNKNDFGFYHQQLQPVAQVILKGLATNEIEILKIGKYKISDDLKIKLESDHFFQLQHKPK